MMSAESNSEKSASYQKKDGRGPARPSFFWYDNDKDLKVCFLVTRVKWLGMEHCDYGVDKFEGQGQVYTILVTSTGSLLF